MITFIQINLKRKIFSKNQFRARINSNCYRTRFQKCYAREKSDSNLANTVTEPYFQAIDKIDFPFPGKSIFRHHKTYVANTSNHNIVIILRSNNL
jgi:hypothetical protein